MAGMIYLVAWTATQPKESIAKHKEHGITTPKGVKVLNDWHAIGQPKGFAIVETSDPPMLHTLSAEWASVGVRVDDVVPIVDGETAKAALARV